MLLGRLCARRVAAPQTALRTARPSSTPWHSAFRRRLHQPASHGRTHQKSSRPILLLASANGLALGTATFVKLSEKDNGGTEQTSEGRMLEVSRDEIEKKTDQVSHGFTRFRHNVVYYLDVLLWEPLCTGVRFLQLAVIFVPVILSVPAIWIGPRQPERDNERSGTLWWYASLVRAMEWAGPAFIKVRHVRMRSPERRLTCE